MRLRKFRAASTSLLKSCLHKIATSKLDETSPSPEFALLLSRVRLGRYIYPLMSFCIRWVGHEHVRMTPASLTLCGERTSLLFLSISSPSTDMGTDAYSDWVDECLHRFRAVVVAGNAFVHAHVVKCQSLDEQITIWQNLQRGAGRLESSRP